MDLRHLRTFVAVAEAGSVSKAALRLHVAQPALSRQIMDLEKELGLSLFDRIGRRVVLTREGKQLVENCRSVLTHVEELAEQANMLRDGKAGFLKVGASPQMIESVLSTFLRLYAEAYPGVRVILTEAVGRDQLMMLERGDIDIGIGQLAAVQDNHRFAGHQLPAAEFWAACHPSHKIGLQATIKLAALAQYPLLLLDSNYVFRKQFDAICRVAGLEANVAFESRAIYTLLALAEAGNGIAVIPSVFPIDRYKLRIVRITHRQKPMKVPMAAIRDRRRTLPPYADEFCKLLANYFRKAAQIGQSSKQGEVARAIGHNASALRK